jgi:hypothetical protein
MLLVMVMAFAFIAQTLRPGRWRIPKLIGIALITAGLGGYVVYSHREQTRKVQEEAATEAVKRAGFESRMSRFAAKQNAVTDWQRPLLARDETKKLYTSELAPLLIRADGRPVLVFATLQNVSVSDGRTEVYFDDATRLKSVFKLQLDCNPEQAHSLMSDNTAYRFAVIAQIRSVEYVLAGDYSLATGNCVDAMPLSFRDYLEFVVEPELGKHTHHAGE